MSRRMSFGSTRFSKGGSRTRPYPRGMPVHRMGQLNRATNWTEFYDNFEQNEGGPQVQEIDLGNSGQGSESVEADVPKMEGWGQVERSDQPQEKFHCDCCPNNSQNLAMKKPEEDPEVVEVVEQEPVENEPMDDDDYLSTTPYIRHDYVNPAAKFRGANRHPPIGQDRVDAPRAPLLHRVRGRGYRIVQKNDS